MSRTFLQEKVVNEHNIAENSFFFNQKGTEIHTHELIRKKLLITGNSQVINVNGVRNKMKTRINVSYVILDLLTEEYSTVQFL